MCEPPMTTVVERAGQVTSGGAVERAGDEQRGGGACRRWSVQATSRAAELALPRLS